MHGDRSGDQVVSFDKRLLHVAHHRQTQRIQRVVVVGADDGRCGEERVIGIDVGGVLGGLLDGFHFELAVGVVVRTDDDGLAEDNIFGRGEVGL